MAASQDKVQSILETLLEQTLPLVNKGIFTSEQLQDVMCKRQKLENNMLKSTFKMSDYLQAIEFEYGFERKRRNRIQTLAPTNPLFKKQGKTDFVIVKRIIRLWDRTMHKFKYNSDLWKQYLDFCIKTDSKKQFYKALSNALRFIPFSEDLWMIGVQYEIEVGLNLWKARKIFIKALRMNNKKVNLWLKMFKFQIHFLKTIFEREKAIEGNESMKFIDGKDSNEMDIEQQIRKEDEHEDMKIKQMNQINLEQHDDILILVYEEALSKIEVQHKSAFMQQINKILIKAIREERDEEISSILKRAQKKLANKNEELGALVAKKQEKAFKPNTNVSLSTVQEKRQYYETFIQQNPDLATQQLDKIFCQFLLKKQELSLLANFFIELSEQKSFKYFNSSTKIKGSSLPPQVKDKMIQAYTSHPQFVLALIKKISPNQFIEYLPLMRSVIHFNKRTRNFKVNTDIHRSVSIICKNRPEIIQRCLHWIHSKDGTEE